MTQFNDLLIATARIGRLRFIFFTLLYFLVYVVMASACLWALVNVVNDRPDWSMGNWPIAVIIVLYVVGLIPHQIPSRRRLADCDLSPNWSLLLFLPLLNAPLLALLLTKPGSATQNRYGHPPTKNPPFVRTAIVILALITCVVVYGLVVFIEALF
ncbi:DUF805 domain-containing protein [Aurantivibrio plasticivorans]